MAAHVKYRCTNRAHKPRCVFDPALCRYCHLDDGQLTTDCPRAFVPHAQRQRMERGQRLDFRAGRWVKEPSPHGRFTEEVPA